MEDQGPKHQILHRQTRDFLRHLIVSSERQRVVGLCHVLLNHFNALLDFSITAKDLTTFKICTPPSLTHTQFDTPLRLNPIVLSHLDLFPYPYLISPLSSIYMFLKPCNLHFCITTS